jgi:tetratricopeptide (TPR) repeat protein
VGVYQGTKMARPIGFKAFLSHSSKDAEFVSAVAEDLGRQYCLVDQTVFETGTGFLRSMEEAVEAGSLFVLFASRPALASAMVSFEIDEARWQVATQVVDRAIVFLIEGGLTHRDLPLWLQRARAEPVTVAAVAARRIRYYLEEDARKRQHALFVGRGREISSLEGRLFPIDGSSPPRAFLVSGLPGIGRRTLAARVASDHWQLRSPLTIRVEVGDTVQDLAIKLADRYEPTNTVAGFKKIAESIAGEDDVAALRRIHKYVLGAVTSREILLFLDEGGILDNDGRMAEPVHSILRVLETDRSAYAGLITRRQPIQNLSLPSVQVRELTNTETKQLISGLASRDDVSLGPELIASLAELAAGYPPSAYHAVQIVRDYGADIALSDNRVIAARVGVLLSYLQKLPLVDKERKVLRLLATVSPLPLPVLGSVLGEKSTVVAPMLSGLVDASLVVPDIDGHLALSEPIREAVLRELQDPPKEKQETREPKLELARALFRALVLAEEPSHRDTSFALASDLISSAERLYHRRDYRAAARYACEAVTQRPRVYEARYLLCRALIKLSEFDEAATVLADLWQMKHFREAKFLEGFMFRHQGYPGPAIKAYQNALQRGYGGIAIHRELAQCHLAVGNIPEARHHIGKASRTGGENRFVVDLEIQIALREGNHDEALEKLALLEAIDDSAFFQHRRSTVMARLGKGQEALDAAKEALMGAGRPTFAMLSQAIVCELRMGRVEHAGNHLRQLGREFPNQNHDIQMGLAVQFECAVGNFREALERWETLRDKDKPVHLALRRNALVGALGGALPDALRAEYTRDVEEITSALGDREFDFEMDDDYL